MSYRRGAAESALDDPVRAVVLYNADADPDQMEADENGLRALETINGAVGVRQVRSPAISREDVAAFAAKGRTAGRYVSKRIPFVYDYYSRDTDVSTREGHGTHVAALAAGYARDGDLTFRGGGRGAGIRPGHRRDLLCRRLRAA